MHKNQCPTPVCLVIPFNSDAPIAKLAVSPKTALQDCLVFNLELLKQLQSSLKTECKSNKIAVMPLQELKKIHRNTSSKLDVEDMSPFGKATFAVQNLSKGDLIVYTGYVETLDYACSLSKAEQIYLAECESSSSMQLIVDSNHTENKSKYIQHLPRTAKLDANQVESLKENAILGTLVTSVFIDSNVFLVPVTVIKIKSNIKASPESKVLLGYDYGQQYWNRLSVQPTYFYSNLAPMIFYGFTINQNGHDNIVLDTNEKGYLELLKDNMNRFDNYLICIPLESNTELKQYDELFKKPLQHSVTISLPALSIIELSTHAAIATLRNGMGYILLITLKPFEKSFDPATLDPIKKFIAGVIHEENWIKLAISISALQTATIAEHCQLASVLNPHTLAGKVFHILQSEQPTLMTLFNNIQEKARLALSNDVTEYENTKQKMPIFSLQKHSLFRTISTQHVPNQELPKMNLA